MSPPAATTPRSSRTTASTLTRLPRLSEYVSPTDPSLDKRRGGSVLDRRDVREALPDRRPRRVAGGAGNRRGRRSCRRVRGGGCRVVGTTPRSAPRRDSRPRRLAAACQGARVRRGHPDRNGQTLEERGGRSGIVGRSRRLHGERGEPLL